MRVPGSLKQRSKSEYDVLVSAAKKELEIVKASKTKICELALEACTIQIGGHRGKGFYTLTMFANDIGLAPKVLNDWVHAYEKVLKPLNIDTPTEKEFSAARMAHVHTAKYTNEDPRDVYYKLKDPKSSLNTTRKVRKVTKNLMFLLSVDNVKGQLNAETLKELRRLQNKLNEIL